MRTELFLPPPARLFVGIPGGPTAPAQEDAATVISEPPPSEVSDDVTAASEDSLFAFPRVAEGMWAWSAANGLTVEPRSSGKDTVAVPDEPASDDTVSNQAMFSPLGWGQPNHQYYARILAPLWTDATYSLRGADLSRLMLDRLRAPRLHLEDVKIDGTRFVAAKMPGSFWDGARGLGTQLRGADLRYASCQSARFVHADFSGATLSHAELQGTLFNQCRFSANTRVQDAVFKNTVFVNMEIGDWILTADVFGARFHSCTMPPELRWILRVRGAIMDSVPPIQPPPVRAPKGAIPPVRR